MKKKKSNKKINEIKKKKIKSYSLFSHKYKENLNTPLQTSRKTTACPHFLSPF